MTLTQTNGSQLLSASEIDLFVSETALQLYNTKVFLDDLADGDEIVIRIFNNDVFAATEKAIDVQTLVGRDVNGIPGVNIPWLPDNSYRVTVQQTVTEVALDFATITWVRHDQ